MPTLLSPRRTAGHAARSPSTSAEPIISPAPGRENVCRKKAPLPNRHTPSWAVDSPRWVAKQRREATGSPQCVGGARTVCWRAGELCGSNPARAAVRYSLGADATADFPGAAWPSRRRSIDEAFVVDRNDSSGCWLHPPHAGSRRLLGVAHQCSASRRTWI